jgi:hypothetical protein
VFEFGGDYLMDNDGLALMVTQGAKSRGKIRGDNQPIPTISMIIASGRVTARPSFTERLSYGSQGRLGVAVPVLLGSPR